MRFTNHPDAASVRHVTAPAMPTFSNPVDQY